MSTPIKIQTAGVYLQATTSPGDRVAMPGYGAGAQVLVYNGSAALAFVEFGTSDVAATGGTTASIPSTARRSHAGPILPARPTGTTRRASSNSNRRGMTA